MKFDYECKLNQEQKLVLTQQMQQSIKILQMPINDLRDYINMEFEENPVLNIKENVMNTENVNKDLKEYDYKEMVKYLEFDNYVAQSYGYYDDEEVSPFNFISEKKSLKEYLYEQLRELYLDPLLTKVAEYIIESLDNRGYLEISIKEISKELKLECSIVEKGLKVVQELEPYGIGARDLKECLKLQLTHLCLLNKPIEYMVDNSLMDIAEGKYKKIAEELGIQPREAQRYGDIIKKLEPKPSRGFFTGDEVKFIITDAEIRNVDGEYFIIMNDKILPKLSINSTYKQAINNEDNTETGEYIKDKLNKAMLLLKGIEQRRNTLYSILEKIIEKQKGFFREGINKLKPMTLKEIAEDIGAHESTVSRAVKDKYILTSFGTIKLKDLFTTGISSHGGNGDTSVINLKNKIKEFIDNEDKYKPLSDQDICDRLNNESFNISRRTVAKYREEMGILSSSKRKRVK